MNTHAQAVSPSETGVLEQLQTVSSARGLEQLPAQLEGLRSWVAGDLHEVERAIAQLEGADTPMHSSAKHLLSLGGKRLRPLCVALASRVGTGFSAQARELAVAVELVHNATLLHDDVIDLGEMRRGAPTARMVYGNAASIYAGDWLLVEALRRIRSVGMNDVFDRSLAVLDEILEAEALQLTLRGTVHGSLHDYFRVVSGKTASLFRWALYAGARAGGASAAQCALLEEYGRRLGIAFQLVDDLLDVSGATEQLGKELFADVREGKLTWPLLVAMEREPALRTMLESVCLQAREGAGFVRDSTLEEQIAQTLINTGALEAARKEATHWTEQASSLLQELPAGTARSALEQVTMVLLQRKH